MKPGDRARLNESGSRNLTCTLSKCAWEGDEGTIERVLDFRPSPGYLIIMDNPALRSTVTQNGAIAVSKYDVEAIS